MKKLALVMLLVVVGAGGCRRKATVGSPASGGIGAVAPREAVQRFLAAAKAQDLDAMSVIWGSAAGPARSTMDRPTWEMREIIMMPCLKHDSFRILGEAPATGGDRVFLVELKYRDLTRSASFTSARDVSTQRWYVLAVDLEKLAEICKRKG